MFGKNLFEASYFKGKNHVCEEYVVRLPLICLVHAKNNDCYGSFPLCLIIPHRVALISDFVSIADISELLYSGFRT